jgi:glucosyl-dolichyl phosphate glucuronosyltransferase
MSGQDRYDVSVVTSTYNRAEVLPRAIEALVTQDAAGARHEVIVVDNNSTDGTQQVVRAFVDRGRVPVRLIFERQPGVSHGRNAGIRAAAAPVIAFTDDDVSVDRRWIAGIKHAFDAHPDVDYVTGKIAAQWEGEPPAWLTGDTWGGPCVIRDRGDEPLYSQPGQFFPGWATANLAVRRRVFDRVGLFSPSFSRGEDLEFILRVWRAGGRGMYAPDVAVTHHVAADRMTRAYHRMWHVREGEIRARLRFKELFDRDGGFRGRDQRNGPTIGGTSAYVYRELLRECRHWFVATMAGHAGRSFRHECQVRQLVSYIRHRHRAAAVQRTGAPAPELAR